MNSFIKFQKEISWIIQIVIDSMNTLFNEECPNCKLTTTFLIDYKNPTQKELTYLCNNCGMVFTKENKLFNEKSDDQKKAENSN